MSEGFDKRLDAYYLKLGAAIIAKQKQAANKVEARLKELTPVATGRARNGWKQERRGNGDLAIVNEVPYIVRLENGYSSQAPRGMVSVVLAEGKLL